MKDEPLEELRGTRNFRETRPRNRLSHKGQNHERQENEEDRRRRTATRWRRQEDLVDQDRGRLPEQGRLLESAVRLPAGPALGDHDPAAGHRSQGHGADRITRPARRRAPGLLTGPRRRRCANALARGLFGRTSPSMYDDELHRFKSDIHFVRYAVDRYGYQRDRRESSVSSHVLRHPATDDKIVVRKDKDGHWTYFSVRDDRDHGTIVDFVQRR